MTKHTPGPWEIEFLGKTVRVQSEVEVTRGGSRIGNDVVIVGDCTNPIDCANARLIAAAPELLKLCKQSLDFINRMNHNIQLIDVLQQTIAKIENKL